MKKQATISKIDYVTEDAILLGLHFSEPINFVAGQFITIRFEKDGKLYPRSYSILTPETNQQDIESCIKLIPGGIGSEALKAMKVGQTIEILGPLGPFVFDKSANTTTNIFIGTGTGMTPLNSMILSHMNNYQEQEFVLLFGAKTQRDLYFHKEFLELEEEMENFTYIPVLSQEAWPENTQGKTGHVQDHLPEDLSDTTFYICGQKPMVLDTVEKLEGSGVAKEHIKFERYS